MVRTLRFAHPTHLLIPLQSPPSFRPAPAAEHSCRQECHDQRGGGKSRMTDFYSRQSKIIVRDISNQESDQRCGTGDGRERDDQAEAFVPQL